MAKKAKAKVGRPSLDASPNQLLRNGHIAVRLREELARRGWKAPDLSERVGSSRDGVVAYRWLSGKGAPSPKLAEKLVGIFGGAVEDFLPRDLDGQTLAVTQPLILDTAPAKPRIHRAAA
jgi:transcriptional regulator with XRE-family HTH domain